MYAEAILYLDPDQIDIVDLIQETLERLPGIEDVFPNHQSKGLTRPYVLRLNPDAFFEKMSLSKEIQNEYVEDLKHKRAYFHITAELTPVDEDHDMIDLVLAVVASTLTELDIQFVTPEGSDV